MKTDLTQIFDGRLFVPGQPGVYFHPFGQEFKYWDGRQWYFGEFCSADAKYNYSKRLVSPKQNTPFQGLLEDPNDTKK